MPLIKYIGRKDAKADNVAGTGLIWTGHGDTQTVSKAASLILLQYPDVWEEVEAGEVATKAPATAGLSSATTGQAEERMRLVDEIASLQAARDVLLAQRDALLAELDELTSLREELIKDKANDSGTLPPPVDSKPEDLSAKTLDELKAIAKDRGIAVGNSGRDRVLDLLSQAKTE
jgi:hypothetical protein